MHPDDIAKYDIQSTATVAPFDLSSVTSVEEVIFFGNQLYENSIDKPTFAKVYHQALDISPVIRVDDGKQSQVETATD
ncbi:Hypothetical protein MVR_LOCUS378 [uncultured virus]|nr:Hypothetical protein MVR_LOCUS378 [uncultured virus]